jgi:hypothetical protein
MRSNNIYRFSKLLSGVLLILLPTPTQAIQKARSDTQPGMVLEIRDYCAGNCERPDRLIFFRLYQDRHVEFETYSEVDVLGGPGCCSIDEHRDMISPEELAEIIRLITQPDLKRARREYKKRHSLPNHLLVRSVQYILRNGQRKRILIENYPIKGKEGRGYYPDSMIEIMERVEKLREKLLR